MVRPVELVESFMHALSNREMKRIMSFLDEQSSWQNVPRPPSKRVLEIELMFSLIIRKSSKVQWKILNSASTDNRA